MQQPCGIAALDVRAEGVGQFPGDVRATLRKIPEVHGALGQQRLAELDGPLQTETEHQVQAVPESQPPQGLAQGLAGRTDVPGGAVGGGDQASGDLRIAAELILQHAQRMLLGAQATIAGGTHVGQQRRPLRGVARAFEESLQVLARVPLRQRTGDHFVALQQQPSQALHQVLGLERLHQVGGRRQCHGGAHAGLVGAVADQDERLLGDRAAQARFAQQLEAIHLRQVQLGQDQREAPAPAMRQRFSAIAAEDQPGIATHAEDQLAKQVATPGVRVGNQDDGGLFRGTHGVPLRTWRTERDAPGMTGGHDTARGHTRV